MPQIHLINALLEQMRTEDYTNQHTDDDAMIAYVSLEKIVAFEMATVGDIRFMRLKSLGDKKTVIWNELKPNTLIKKHHHDCWEHTEIKEGSIFYRGREFCEGDTVHIAPFTDHIIKAGSEGAILYVIMDNPK